MSKATSLPGSRTRCITSDPAIVKFTPAGTKTTFAFGPLAPYALAFEPITEKLRNISARALVQGGENVLIAGLVVGGNALANNGVILRAIGPSLSTYGIANPCAIQSWNCTIPAARLSHPMTIGGDTKIANRRDRPRADRCA